LSIFENEQRLELHGFAAEDESDGQAAEQGQGRGEPERVRAALLGNRAVLPESRLHRARTSGKVLQKLAVLIADFSI